MSKKRKNMDETETTTTNKTETETERKSRKLDVDQLREMARGLPEAEGDLLTKRIDAYVETTEARKIASKKLRQAVALLSA